MNKRRFGKPMRLKAVLEYCKLSEKEKKEYKEACLKYGERSHLACDKVQ